jgi:hypothetical protein
MSEKRKCIRIHEYNITYMQKTTRATAHEMYRTYAPSLRGRVNIEHHREREGSTNMHMGSRFSAFRRWYPLRSTFVKPLFELMVFWRPGNS